MTFSLMSRAGSLVLALLLAGCATPAQQAAMPMRQGTIEQITPTQIVSSYHSGVGAVIGGVGGLGVGNLVGSGTGRDVAEVIGALGSRANHLDDFQRKYEQPIDGQDIIVRISNGVLVFVTQPITRPLSVGQRVYIEGTGDLARVIPR